MTKARILADFISDGSSLADGTISVAEVSGAAPLASPTFTGTVTATGDITAGFGSGDVSGALNGVTGALSRASSSSVNLLTLTNGHASNNNASLSFTNTDGSFFIGKDRSTGGAGLGGAYEAYMYTNTSRAIVFGVNNAEKMRIDSSGGLITKPAAGGHAVFNENSVDADFRVESDTNTHALFVDAGNNRVGVGEGAPFTTLQVGARTGAGTTNPNTGSVLSVSKDGATGIDLGGNVNAGAVVGAINWVNYYGVGNYNTARIDTYAQGQSNSGELRFWTASVASSPTERMRISQTGGLITTPAAGGDAVFNEGGVNADFRVESDANTHMLFVDASTNRIGMNDSAPASTLSIISDEAQLIIGGTTGGNARGLKNLYGFNRIPK
jgi:hypothetical protein